MTEQERFKQYVRNINCDAEIVLRKEADGSYRNPTTKLLWETWKAATAQAVPEGYVVVPVEPTQVMLDKFPEVVYQDTYAGECSVWVDDDTIRLGYKAMIKAAQENN